MFKQDNEEKNSNDLLTDLTERTGLTFDAEPARDERFDLGDAAPADAPEAPTETALTAHADTLPETQEEPDALPAEEEEEPEIDPLDVRVFGLPRLQFWGVTMGIGVGYIVHGFLGMVITKPFSVWWPAIACAAIGYFITGRMHKQRVAARDAENQKNS